MRPKVTLLGWETGYDEVAEEFGLNIERRVDKSFMGVPLFNSMIKRANDSTSLVTVIINGDILLFEDFYMTLHKVVSSFRDFLIVGARYDIDALPDVEETNPAYTSTVRTAKSKGRFQSWSPSSGAPRLFTLNEGK